MASALSKLLTPLTASWDWQLNARCRNLDSELFFPREGEERASRLRRERVAKQVCALCPVRHECRAYALSHREPYGIWGGTNEIDRRDFEPPTSTCAEAKKPLGLTPRYRAYGYTKIGRHRP